MTFATIEMNNKSEVENMYHLHHKLIESVNHLWHHYLLPIDTSQLQYFHYVVVTRGVVERGRCLPTFPKQGMCNFTIVLKGKGIIFECTTQGPELIPVYMQHSLRKRRKQSKKVAFFGFKKKRKKCILELWYAVSLQVTVMKPAVGCHYFPLDRSLSQSESINPLAGTKLYCLVRGTPHMYVYNLPRVITRPGIELATSRSLVPTTSLPSHTFY